MTRGIRDWKPWLLSGLAGVVVFLGLSLVVPEEPTAAGWWFRGGWPWLILKGIATLLAVHVVFWWRPADQGTLPVIVIGFLGGTLFFLVVLDARLLHPFEPWPANLTGEGSNLEQAQQAWTDYRAAPWAWTGSQAADNSGAEPVGNLSQVLAHGAIPLLAVPAKVLWADTPEPVQYFGLWLLLSYALQGVFAGLLMRCLTLDPRLRMLGIGFFVLSPILLNSVGYVATTAHWLLLAGLWLYFRTVGAGRQAQAWLGWVCLGVLSAAVHGQLALMILALALVFVGRCIWLDRSISPGRGLAEVLALLAALAGTGWALGYSDWRSVVGVPAAAEVGLIDAMNLAGPLDPAGWSVLLQSWALPPDQSSVSFAYLGAGVIALICCCLVMIMLRPLDRAGFRPWVPALGLGAVLTVLALLPRLAVGPHIVLDLTSIEWVAGHGDLFAATGRYFWLVSYAILFLLIALVVHGLPARRAALLLGLALTLQAADLQDRLQSGRLGGWETIGDLGSSISDRPFSP